MVVHAGQIVLDKKNRTFGWVVGHVVCMHALQRSVAADPVSSNTCSGRLHSNSDDHMLLATFNCVRPLVVRDEMTSAKN